MKLPINWLERYIKLEHKIEELGDIFTKLDSMQDGPIEYVDNKPVLNLEIRQNRPDLLSILGLAREYSAYINRPLEMPEIWQDTEIIWGKPDKILDVKAVDIVKRFTAVEIKNVKIQKSPQFIIDHLSQYGIQSINNIVDITNYVMLEFGIPMHAFDYNRLKKGDSEAILTLRRAQSGENFETWLKTKIKLSKEDLIVADGEKAVSIGGIIGGINSGITDKTKNIILEAAVYEHSFIRKTARRHNLTTDSSTRHEKILNTKMVEVAIRRAIHLILEHSGGQIIRIEDYYETKVPDLVIDLDINEIERLSGISIETQVVEDYLKRLEFMVLDYKEAVEVNAKQIKVRVPDHRTDIELEEDLVEEVLRLNGYEKIPYQEITNATPINITPKSYILEDKLKDILVSLNLSEHILMPIVKYNESNKHQIKLENSLNADLNALRTNIFETLESAKINLIKNARKSFGIFEIGKIYLMTKVGEYKEEKRTGIIYHNCDFYTKVKADFIAILHKLNINLESDNITFEEKDNSLIYKYTDSTRYLTLAILKSDKIELINESIEKIIDLQVIPFINVSTATKQTIIDNFSFIIDKDVKLGDISNAILKSSEYIKRINLLEELKYAKDENQKITNIEVVFEDDKNSLTRKQIADIRNEFLDKLATKFGVKLKK